MQERNDIYDPTIEQCKRGMMVRTHSDSGAIMIQEVSGYNVIVRCYIGGTLECSKRVHITDVEVVWTTGKDYDENLSTIKEFETAIKRLPQYQLGEPE